MQSGLRQGGGLQPATPLKVHTRSHADNALVNPSARPVAPAVVQPPDAAWERLGEDAGGGERMRECNAVARAAPAGLTFLTWSSFSSVK